MSPEKGDTIWGERSWSNYNKVHDCFKYMHVIPYSSKVCKCHQLYQHTVTACDHSSVIVDPSGVYHTRWLMRVWNVSISCQILRIDGFTFPLKDGVNKHWLASSFPFVRVCWQNFRFPGPWWITELKKQWRTGYKYILVTRAHGLGMRLGYKLRVSALLSTKGRTW